MNATPWLVEVGRALQRLHFDAVLIGNAAAALQGAPVTTVDFDFLFRKTPANLRKLKSLSRALDAIVLRPYYPVSDLYRVVRERDGLQLDFMSTIHGVRTFAGLRARATAIEIAGVTISVASLADITKSTRAARRPRGRCSMSSKRRAKQPNVRARRLAALKREAERDLMDLIRRRLALPPSQRTNFLRVRVPFRGTAL